MQFPDRSIVERVRQEYPAGTRVILEEMADPQAPPVGTMGTVQAVDDSASLVMRWDNGSGLNVVYGEDRGTKRLMTEKVYQQIMEIRSGGQSNMLDSRAVQRQAFEADFFDLVLYIEDHPKEYFHFIMTGREE